ncbi:hypothetical protein ACIBCM_32025 [Streptomyces sp. NPDC051018]|uniref:hypothetical protein n=1 Tax=Streptomyces sp. NPDC051018 TaxID=3365639 RepID=UPI0037A02FFF
MSFIDHHDVFIGSTDDGWTFAVLNRHLPREARQSLTDAGFTARAHQGRTLYLFPPGQPTAETHERAGIALYGLLAHTMDFADLFWTTRWPNPGPAKADVRITVADDQVTATARSTSATEILAQHGFLPTPAGRTLPAGLSERDRVAAIVRAESHLHADGITVHVSLGIPTLNAIPPAPGWATGPTPGPASPTRPRTR